MNKKVIAILSILTFLLIIGSIITLVYATNNSNTNIKIEKTNSQILYLDNEITKIINNINNISKDYNVFNRKQDVDWESIEKDICKLYSSWNSIIIDFNNLEIQNTTLTDFGKKLDDISISVKNKNKSLTLSNLADLYYFLTLYINYYKSDIQLKNNINTKFFLIKAYSLVETNNWTLIYENLENAVEAYYNNISSIDINNNNKFNNNKIYVSIKELENISRVKDIDLFYLKYSIIMNNFNYYED